MVEITSGALSEENPEDAENPPEVKPLLLKEFLLKNSLMLLPEVALLLTISEKLAESPEEQEKLLLKEEEVAHPKPWNTLVTKLDLVEKEVHALAWAKVIAKNTLLVTSENSEKLNPHPVEEKDNKRIYYLKINFY